MLVDESVDRSMDESTGDGYTSTDNNAKNTTTQNCDIHNTMKQIIFFAPSRPITTSSRPITILMNCLVDDTQRITSCLVDRKHNDTQKK